MAKKPKSSTSTTSTGGTAKRGRAAKQAGGAKRTGAVKQADAVKQANVAKRTDAAKQADAPKRSDGPGQTDAPKPGNGSRPNNGAQQADAAQQADTAQQADAAPSMNIMGQYLKDLSFENPNAPQSLSRQENSPKIDISVNVAAKTLAATDYEVELQFNVKAMDGDMAVFQAEMQYAGIFRLENVPREHMQPIVLIECPRMLFPFARHILADAVRNGGFPPLMLDPIDFNAMYQQRMEKKSPQTGA